MEDKAKTPAGTGASNVVHLFGKNISDNMLRPPERQVYSEDQKLEILKDACPYLSLMPNKALASRMLHLLQQDLRGITT